MSWALRKDNFLPSEKMRATQWKRNPYKVKFWKAIYDIKLKKHLQIFCVQKRLLSFFLLSNKWEPTKWKQIFFKVKCWKQINWNQWIENTTKSKNRFQVPSSVRGFPWVPLLGSRVYWREWSPWISLWRAQSMYWHHIIARLLACSVDMFLWYTRL